jgi:mannose-6-phosphate isomerase-like protein (cupin superfamily)
VTGPLRFAFTDGGFEDVVAHGGRGRIAAARVLQQPPYAGATFVDLVVVPPGGSIGLHTHDRDNEEIYVIVEGRGTMQVDGETFGVGPGDVVVNRPGGTHGLDNTGSAPLRLVVVEVAVG